MQVALHVDFHVDERMTAQLFQHMVEEADAGRDRRCARAVDIDGNGNRSLVGLA
ncbi:hypothetical protein D3C72_2535920 [compost metagenome]